MDELDLSSLTFEIEDAFSTLENANEIAFSNRNQMEALADSTVEEIVLYILSKL